MLQNIAVLVSGLILGGLIGWFAARANLLSENARLAAQLDAERRSVTERVAILQQAEQKLRDAFQALSAEALRHNNQSFLDLARETLGAFQQKAIGDIDSRQKAISDLVAPIEQSLRGVDLALHEVEKTRIDAYAGLRQQLETMAQTNRQLQTDTSNLVKALRAPAVRGRWGEIQLKRVVELAGMLERCDFYEQRTVHAEDGRLRPDLVVRLPGGKYIVVDAKTPLTAYLEALEATDDTAREGKLREHSGQVRDHMNRLAAKGYWEELQPAPEFVVMFLPGEAFFTAALQYDPALIEFGVEQSVIVASPTTLIALLRAVAYGWRQERLADSAQVISNLGRELHDRIRIWAEHLMRVGKHLDGAIEAYNSAVGSLESRVLVSTRRLADLGVPVTGAIPELEPIDRIARDVPPENRPA